MANRKAPRLNEQKYSYTEEFTVEDAAHIYVGTMVERVDSTDEVRPATAVSGTFVLGVARFEVDNTDDGEKSDWISTSIHGMKNAGNVSKDNIGDVLYVVDSETVGTSAASSATTNPAGICIDVDSSDSLVYVDFDPAKKN